MADTTHEISHHKKSYAKVGIALLILTIITVSVGLVSWFDVGPPGPDGADVLLGLSIATVKASLVALIFMHLNHEKGLIYKMLVFVCILGVALIVLSLFGEFDPIVEQFDTHETTGGWLTTENPQP